MRAQVRVLALETLGVAARPGEAGYAIGGAAFGIVLGAGRAASRLWVTSYLADLLSGVSVMMHCRCMLYCSCASSASRRAASLLCHSVFLSTSFCISPSLSHCLSQCFSISPKIFQDVPCICRRLGQCGWRRPSCGRWRRARRYGHIRCAGPVASASAAWAGRHRRRQGASQAWPASSRDATATGDDDDVTTWVSGELLAWAGLATSVSPASSTPGGRKNPESRSGRRVARTKVTAGEARRGFLETV